MGTRSHLPYYAWQGRSARLLNSRSWRHPIATPGSLRREARAAVRPGSEQVLIASLGPAACFRQQASSSAVDGMIANREYFG